MLGGGSTSLTFSLLSLFFSSWYPAMVAVAFAVSQGLAHLHTRLLDQLTTSNLTHRIHPSSQTQTEPENEINTAQNSNIPQQHRRSAVVTPPIAKTILSLLATQTVPLLTPESAPFQTASTDSGRPEITLAPTR